MTRRWDQTLGRNPTRLAHVRGIGHPDEAHDALRARREWQERWGITVRGPGRCPARRLTGRHSLGCCYQDGSGFQQKPWPRAFDHTYNITRQHDNARGVLTMPYGLTDEDAAELTEWCSQFRVNWTALGDGWHYPGTVAVVIFP